jgi:nucleoside-diphosphate-sugar epimerase
LGEIELQRRAGELPITVIRPGIVYGPADRNVAVLFRAIYRTRVHVVIGFRTPPLSLVYVDDLVSLILAAAERGERLPPGPAPPAAGQGVYQACDDREFPDYREFGKRIAAALDRRVIVWPLWRWVGRGVSFTVETGSRLCGRSSFLTVDKVREATASSWACSGEKARQQLGFVPPQRLDARLRETGEWFREAGWL